MYVSVSKNSKILPSRNSHFKNKEQSLFINAAVASAIDNYCTQYFNVIKNKIYPNSEILSIKTVERESNLVFG